MPRYREPFQVRRAGGERQPTKRLRKNARIVKINRELAIGSVLVLVVLLVAGGLWLGNVMRGKPGETKEPEAPAYRPGTAVLWQGPNPADVAARFTAATTHAERLKWVRQAAKVGPAMEAFFRDGPGAAEKVVETRPLAPSGEGELLYENYEVVLEGGGARLLAVSVDPRGAKVDFEAYARYCSESWEDLVSGAVAAADEMRVILRPGGFYLNRFADETRWMHFKATTPDLEDSLDFYAERGSEAARDLGKAGELISQVTLSIRPVEDSAKFRQFEITGVKAIGWVEP